MMINPLNTKMELSIRPMRHIFFYFEDKYGKNELKKFIESTGMPLEYFNDENNWVSYDYYCLLLKTLVEYTGNVNSPYEFGVASALKYGRSWGIVRKMISAFGTCTSTFKTVVLLSPRWQKIGKIHPIRKSDFISFYQEY